MKNKNFIFIYTLMLVLIFVFNIGHASADNNPVLIQEMNRSNDGSDDFIKKNYFVPGLNGHLLFTAPSESTNDNIISQKYSVYDSYFSYGYYYDPSPHYITKITDGGINKYEHIYNLININGDIYYNFYYNIGSNDYPCYTYGFNRLRLINGQYTVGDSSDYDKRFYEGLPEYFSYINGHVYFFNVGPDSQGYTGDLYMQEIDDMAGTYNSFNIRPIKTIQHISIYGQKYLPEIKYATAINNKLYFLIKDKSNYYNDTIWISDGTENGTKPLQLLDKDGNDINENYSINGITKINNSLYFFYEKSGVGYSKMMKITFNEDGTYDIKNVNNIINTVGDTNVYINQWNLNDNDDNDWEQSLSSNNIFYFTAQDNYNNGGNGLYSINTNTDEIQTLLGGNSVSINSNIVAKDNNLYFFAKTIPDSDSYGTEFWTYNLNTNSASMVKDINECKPSYYNDDENYCKEHPQDSYKDYPDQNIIKINNVLYFSADYIEYLPNNEKNDYFQSIFRSDGTGYGTIPVFNNGKTPVFNNGKTDSANLWNARDITYYNGALYFLSTYNDLFSPYVVHNSVLTLPIATKDIQIKINEQQKVYGYGDPSLTYDVEYGPTGYGYGLTLNRMNGENVGNYAINIKDFKDYRISFDDNQNNLPYLNISKRPITITADSKTKVYGDQDPNLTYTITSGSLINGDAINGSLSRDIGENVGTYNINIGTLTAGNNYAITYNKGIFTISNITKKSVTVSGTTFDCNKEYDGSESVKITSPGLLNGIDDSDKGYVQLNATGIYNSKDVDTQKSITITYSLTGSKAYKYELNNYGIYNIDNCIISKRPITITADSKTKVYGDQDPNLTYTITSGSLINGDAINGSLSRDIGENVGTYNINIGTLTAGNNYAITYNKGIFNINKKIIKVSASGENKEYDGDIGAIVKLSGIGIVNEDDIKFKYNNALFKDSNVGVDKIIDITGISLENEDSSNYILDNSYSNISTKANINPRKLYITAKGIYKTYGDQDPNLTYTITSGSLINGDAINGSLSRSAGENTGIYDINIGTLTAGNNYEIIYTNNNFIIKPKNIEIVANPITKIYGDIDPPLTYSIKNGEIINNGDLTIKLIRTQGENIGSYNINQIETSGINKNNYCVILSSPSFFTIDKLNDVTKIAPEILSNNNNITAKMDIEDSMSNKEIVIPPTVNNIDLNFSYGILNNTINLKQAIQNINYVNEDNIISSLPQIVLTSKNSEIYINKDNEVTSTSLWDFKINYSDLIINDNLNKTITKSLSTNNTKAILGIDIGSSNDLKLTKGVRIVMKNQAGKRVGYIPEDNKFYEIINKCYEDSQDLGNSLSDNESCKIDVGSDLIIWTKHFTKFIIFDNIIQQNYTSKYIGTAYCSNFVYGDWGKCENGYQNRSIISWNGGNICNKDLAIIKQNCVVNNDNNINNNINNDDISPFADENKTEINIVKKYGKGILLRSIDNKIYSIENGKLYHIKTIKELKNDFSGGKIINVDNSIINSYAKTDIRYQEYKDGSLLRTPDGKIYVLINGKKQHIKTLKELKQKYFNKPIYNVSYDVLNQYQN